ncbi:MAG: hypothetical protein HY519_02050 [Candidatus Aenigmarchaeota archaeon]|nr:hypothetical protein [Candidatus Aenigmarchaeota archaeon]
MKALLLAIAFLALVPQTAFSQEAQVLRIASQNMVAGQTHAIGIILDGAPDGLAGYGMKVTVSDQDVLEIVDVLYVGAEGIEEKTVKSAAEATLAAIDSGTSVQKGAKNVLLAYVYVKAKQAGTAELNVEGQRLDDDLGNQIEIAVAPGTISVSAAPDAEADAGSQIAGMPAEAVVILAAAALVILIMLAVHWYRNRITF